MLANHSMRRWSIVIFVVLLVSFGVGNGAGAATRAGLHFQIGCSGFTTNDGGLILDRDNTGTGRETVYITATDGAGQTLLITPEMTFFVGGQTYFADGAWFAWDSAPTVNPITVAVISPAGNQLEEQVIYQSEGHCGDLGATITETGVALTGTTSISVGLNALPPEGSNPEGTGRAYPGYLVVNTSWLNIRSGDGVAYTVVGRVRGGVELIVLGVNEPRSWWYIQAGEIVGWVTNEFVINRGDLSDAPVVEAEGELLPPRFYVYADITLWGLPGESGGPLCEIAGGLEYWLVGQSSSGQSVKIEAVCNGETITGWLMAEYGAIRNAGVIEIPVLEQ